LRRILPVPSRLIERMLDMSNRKELIYFDT